MARPRRAIRIWLTAFLLAVGLTTARSQAADEPFNVILILADDLGWSDLACYGADLHETPHLDRLAAGGVRFTQAYAPAPVCSPTRAAILTGLAPARLGITIWSEGATSGPRNRRLLQADSLPDLPHAERTLAELFQTEGYLTATVGKWHLGDAAHAPETQGFDVNIGGTHWGAPTSFFWPYRGARSQNGEFRYVPHLEFGGPDEYLTDRLTQEALRVVDHAAREQRPFFLILSHHAPHTPIEAPDDDTAHFATKIGPTSKHRHPVYAAMVRRLDASVGQIRERLGKLNLDRRTVVVFTSDNGGYLGTTNVQGQEVAITNNWPLRSGKGSCYEGGLRVPLIVAWPGVTRPGAVCHEPVLLTDLFPTLSQLLSPSSRISTADAVDLTPVLRVASTSLRRETLYFHYPHYYHAPATTPCGAIRHGDWKLVEHFEDGRFELFNLKDDPGEQHDVARDEPARAAQLAELLRTWRSDVGAKMPKKNPSFPDNGK